MKSKNKFTILTLNPEKIISRPSIESKENDHYEFKLHLDFTRESFDENNVLISAEKNQENALLTQIVLAMKEMNPKFVPDEESLKYQLFYLDFSNLFKKKDLRADFDAEAFKKKVDDGMTKEDLQMTNLHRILFFLFRNGFRVKFDDGVERHYIPFDSSASMTRNARISFINEELKSKLDERLLLGMDLNKEQIEVAPHKYFAYRGLYMSDATRIDTNDKFVLNEETVIVLRDDGYKTEKIDTISAEKRDDYWAIGSVKKEIKINPFDGEGLIHPDYADEINRQLFKNKKKATSFQIRMPFTKGMLHCVDYISFIDKECNADPSKEYLVTDLYDIPRDLRKAKIILTKSMLKNSGWLGDYVDKAFGKSEDPMKYMFEKMEQYKHSLYIARTDLSLHNEKKSIKLNYQCLKTLDMSRKEFRSMIQKYIDEIEIIKSDPIKQREFVLEDKVTPDCTWKYALSQNLAFLNEKYIKEQVKNEIESAIRDIYKGNIRVSGENRFLSCDLLALLIHVIKRADSKDEAAIEELKKNCIKSKNFKLPMPQVELQNGKKYGFLRNPHLSGNEDCVLALQEKNKYDKYFENLSGIIMTAYDSIAPMTMGGADFDGDMVKIIYDDDIILAMDNSKKKHEEVIVIPSQEETPVPVPQRTEYVHVKDTYGNQIGSVCNCAIRLDDGQTKSLKEEGFPHRYIPADCTILAGLEIDSAKNGNHPKNNIAELKERFKGSKQGDYIQMLDGLKKVNWKEVKIRDTKKTLKTPVKGQYHIYCGDPHKDVDIAVKFEGDYEGYSNLEMLMPMFFKTMYSQKENDEEWKELKKVGNFTFDKENVKIENSIVETIFELYNMYSKRFRSKMFEDEMNSKQKWFAKAYMIAKMQYYGQDDYEEHLVALKGLYSELEYVITETPAGFYEEEGVIYKCENIIDRIQKKEWIYQSSDKRHNTLKEILPEENFGLLYENGLWVDLLTNFSRSGYMILYYLIKEIETQNSKAKEKKDENLVKKHYSDRDYLHDIGIDVKEAMRGDLFNILGDSFKKAVKYKYTFTAFDQLLLDTIRDRLIAANVFHENTIVKGFYYKKPDFFWKLYDGKDGLKILKDRGYIKPYDPLNDYSENEEEAETDELQYWEED